MTAKEVLYDSETLLRLLDSEIAELRSAPVPSGVVSVSQSDLAVLQQVREQKTEADARVASAVVRNAQ
jgi:hypothetical protein